MYGYFPISRKYICGILKGILYSSELVAISHDKILYEMDNYSFDLDQIYD